MAMLFERAQVLNGQQNSAELVGYLVFDSDFGRDRFVSQNVMEAEIAIWCGMEKFVETVGLIIEHIKTGLWVDVVAQRLVPKLVYVLDLTN